MPKISIIVPIYNKEEYLDRFLNSIINQTLKNIEIILIDDGSSDNSLVISEKFKKKDKRVKVVSQKNQGVSVARNTGLKYAQGEYIGFADPDDWLEEDMFLKMLKKCEETNSPVCISNYFQETKDDIIERELNIAQDVLTGAEIDKHILLKMIGPLIIGEPTIMSSVWRLLIKRDLIISNNITFPKNIDRMQDLAFSLEVFIHTDKACIVKDYLYHYKVHDDSASSVYNVNTFEQLTQILPIVEKILQKHQINLDNRIRINNRYLYIGMKSISNEAKTGNPNSLRSALENIRGICAHKKVQSAVRNVDLDQYPFRKRFVLKSIENIRPFLLISYYRLAQIVFH